MLEFSLLIACDIHPVNNMRVLRYLQAELGISAGQKDAWYRHCVAEGLTAAERLLKQHGRPPWCFGDAPTLANCCLTPQIANAPRMGCDLSPYPLLMRAHHHAAAHPAFMQASPEQQPDFTR